MDRIQSLLHVSDPAPPPDFPSPSLIGEGELGRVGGSCRRPMGAACPPTSGNPCNQVTLSPARQRFPASHLSMPAVSNFPPQIRCSLLAPPHGPVGGLLCSVQKPASAHLGCHSANFPSRPAAILYNPLAPPSHSLALPLLPFGLFRLHKIDTCLPSVRNYQSMVDASAATGLSKGREHR